MTRENKIKRLQELVDEYVGYLTYYSKAEVIDDNEFIVVRYSEPKKLVYPFQSIKFPYTDIDKRIEHYRHKIKTMKSHE